MASLSFSIAGGIRKATKFSSMEALGVVLACAKSLPFLSIGQKACADWLALLEEFSLYRRVCVAGRPLALVGPNRLRR
jgi:hypothetical protein